MKKIIVATILLALGSFVLSSCKTHERCPAYGTISQPAHKKAV